MDSVSRYVDEALQMYHNGHEKVEAIHCILRGLYEHLHSPNHYVLYVEPNRHIHSICYLHVVQQADNIVDAFADSTKVSVKLLCEKSLPPMALKPERKFSRTWSFKQPAPTTYVYQVLELQFANTTLDHAEILDYIDRHCTEVWGPCQVACLRKRRGWLMQNAGLPAQVSDSAISALYAIAVLYKQKHLKRGKELTERIQDEVLQSMNIPLIVFDLRDQTQSYPIDPLQLVYTFTNRAFRELVGLESDLDLSPHDQRYEDDTRHAFAKFLQHEQVYEALHAVMNNFGEESPASSGELRDDYSWGSGKLPTSIGHGASITKTIEYGDDLIPLRHYELHIYRVNGTRVGIVMKDISEKIEHLHLIEQASKAKTEFLASINHELRTPLNSIDGNLQLLMRTSPLTDRQLDLIHRMRLSGTALMSLLQEVLDYAKLEQRRMRLHIETFSLRHCIQSALDVISSAANKRRVALRYEMGLTVPSLVVGDSFRIQQILVNLLSNAINFTENGSVTIQVEAEDQVIFSVIDTGDGVDQEARDTLFKPWYQGNPLQARATRGTGLGLAISKELVELMGGRIWLARSQPGQGSTFSFAIPLARVGPGTIASSSLATPELDLIKGKRVIVLHAAQDDEKRQLVKALLQWGMQPTVCTTSEEVVDYMSAGQEFELALFDLCAACDGDAKDALASWVTLNQPHTSLVSIASSLDEYAQCAALFRATLMRPLLIDELFNVVVNIFSLQQPAPTPSPEPPTLPVNHRMNILVVEDVVENQQVLVDMLRVLGYENVTIAENGSEMLHLLGDSSIGPFSLILLDLLMPVMNGMDAVQEYRQRFNKPLGTLPYIVAVTATTLISEDPKSYNRAGMDAFIQKPIKMNHLQALLEVIK